MKSYVWIVALVLVTSCAFAAKDGNGAGVPANTRLGTPEREKPALRGDLQDMASGLREEIAAAKSKSPRRAAYHRARAQVIYRTLTVERKLTPAQMRSMYEQIVSGEAIPDLAPDVDWAKDRGILIGRFGDLSSTSYECSQPLSLQRFTTALRRFGRQMSWFAFWMSLPGMIALLWLLYRWWTRRRRRAVPVGPAPVFLGPVAPAPVAPVGTPGVPNGAYRGGGYIW